MKRRTIATFSTTIPDDTQWSEEDEIVVPGGKAIACAVRDYLQGAGAKCDDPALRDSYGWEFSAQLGGRLFTIVVQLVDEWILQCEPAGNSKDEATSAILRSIAKALSSDHRFDSVRWYHSQDFEKGDLTKGSVEPC